MAKTKLKIRFFTIADYEKEQKWLEEMHRQGWRPKRFSLPCFYLFEQCEPEEMIYQLEFNERELDADYLQLLQDCGWTYLFTCMCWRYFCKPAGEGDGACELFTDDDSRLEQVRRVFRRRMVPVLVVFTCIVAPNLIVTILNDESTGPAYLAVRGIYIALVLLNLILFAACGHGFQVLYRKYGKKR